MQFNQADGHHGKIGHHVVLAEEAAYGFEHPRRLDVRPFHHLGVGLFGRQRPVPGIVERLDLRLALVAVRRLEQHIVGGVGIERRVEIDEIDALAGDVLAQHREVVTIEQLVGHAARHN